MSERGSAGTSERDYLSDIIFNFLGFTTTIGAHSISEEDVRFFLYGFPDENSVSLVSCDYCCACYSLS